MASRPADFFGSSVKTVLNKPFFHCQDQKPSGTHGGTSIAGWQTRVLNTVLTNDIVGASLSSNSVNLPAGTYYIEAFSSSYIDGVRSLCTVVKNSDSSEVLRGIGSSSGNYSNQNAGVASGIVTLTNADSIRVNYYTNIAAATSGLGVAIIQGVEVYTDLKIWQLDRSLEIAPKAVNSGLQTVPSLDTTGNIMGFDISKTGANQVTVTKGSCLNSTLETPMALTVDTALAIPAVANTIYHIFVVRLVSDGSFTVKAYTTEAGVASDGTVDKWRWIGFWRTNGSSECVVAYMNDGVMQFGKASENQLPDLVTTTYATKDNSSHIPEPRVSSVVYGVKFNVAGTLITSLDGVNMEAYVGYNNGAAADTSFMAWGFGSNAPMAFLPYSSIRQFKTDAGSMYLLIQAVKLKR